MFAAGAIDGWQKIGAVLNQHFGGRMMIRRVALLAVLAVCLLATPLAADAQQAGKVPRIGFLSLTSASDRPRLLDAFRQRLRELGWVEGQKVVIDYRYAEGRVDRLSDLAAELVRLKVDLIVVFGGTQVVTAAKNATETIPIVMIGIRDPVGTGVIASLARPGGNVTGVSGSAGLEFVAKQLELLKETVPNIRRVAILSNPANPYHQLAIREVNVAARSLGVQLQLLEARGPNEFDGAFAAMAKERVEALLVLSNTMFNSHRTRLANLAARSRLPAAYGVRESVEAGGLMSYGPSFLDFYRRAATYVDKILKGAHQYQNGDGARSDDPAVVAGAGGRSNPVTAFEPRLCRLRVVMAFRERPNTAGVQSPRDSTRRRKAAVICADF